MTDLIEVRVSNLVGAALDWAVAKAADVRMFEMGPDGNWPGNFAVTQATQVEPAVIRDLMGRLWFEASLRSVPWSPSTDWSQGGPLIDKHGGSVQRDRAVPLSTRYSAGPDGDAVWCYGPTPLIAFCRGLVRYKLGDTVQVPKELIHAD
ncbi:phage protein NinX family protein [Pseudomonas asiatica]|uniref:phage protein NinX family protein n=1 Tax=Pseudomonas asiatica TaxID=2219225 RepID=UPI0025A492BE|nr:phage protein NinX family protein [Pseudomonas asiatica]WJN52065.1 DUF2591 family protein [Pseudomonas asiatica]